MILQDRNVFDALVQIRLAKFTDCFFVIDIDRTDIVLRNL